MQYNQYIYFYEIKNVWSSVNYGDGEKKNCTFQLTRICIDLEKWTVANNISLTAEEMIVESKEMANVGPHFVKLEAHDSVQVDEGKVVSQGARCVVFSTPMSGPPVIAELGEKRARHVVDLIENHDK